MSSEKIATVVIAHFNRPIDVFEKTIDYICDFNDARYVIIDGGSTKENISILLSKLKNSSIEWMLIGKENVAMDHGAYWMWIQTLINNQIPKKKYCISNVKKELFFDSNITWFAQEHMSDHMINITAERGWHRNFNDRISIKKCNEYLNQNPKDQIGIVSSTKDKRLGHTIWNPLPQPHQGRDVAKEIQGIVDHDYWNRKFNFSPDSVHSGGAHIWIKNDRIKDLFKNVEITDEEIRRPGFPWEAERFMMLQLNEKYGGKHLCYWDLFYDEKYKRSWFSFYFIHCVLKDKLVIPPSPNFNAMLYNLYGRNHNSIREKWDDDQILFEMRKLFGKYS